MVAKEVEYILEELVGCSYKKKNTTHLNQFLRHFLLEKGNLPAIWSAFPAPQLGLMSDLSSLSQTNRVCSYMAGPKGKASISFPSASRQLCASLH